MSIDPTTVRVSDTLLLSDLVGCDSVYRHGYANPVNWNRKSQYFKEATKLGKLYDRLHDEYGPYSISYGYISPQLSKLIVKYQNPDMASYHRWDNGAAADSCFHRYVFRAEVAPIKLAHEIDEYYQYSRMITYSESPWICIATRYCEGIPSRKAFYENRYMGEKKPKHVRYSDNKAKRLVMKTEHTLEHDWEGNGHPTYHGGGREQYQHIRLGYNVMLTDLLYKAKYVHRGIKNKPPLDAAAFLEKAQRVAAIIDMVVHNTGARVSVVRAYDSRKCWTEHKTPIEIVPHWADAQEVADIICGNAIQAEIRETSGGIERVRFYV